MKATLVFGLCYSLFCFLGSMFLVGWVGGNFFKDALLIFFKFPIDWAKLIAEKSLWYLLLNIMFWTTIFHFLVIIVKRIGKEDNSSEDLLDYPKEIDKRQS